MGWIKNVKQNVLAGEATRAIEEGRTIYAPMLNTPLTQSSSAQMSGAVSGWAEMIEAIESCGWRLEHWTVGMDVKGRPQAYPLFRRSK